MRLNENTKINGNLVILVPYEAKHVEKYHFWMESPELRELTASEPLTLEQEYAMQQSWRNDEDKCTFLVVSRQLFEANGGDEIASLIGDTNLFLRLDNKTKEKIGEVEIMIAEVEEQGKGYGWEAVLLLLKYAQTHLEIGKFEAKIGYNNIKSLSMFKKMHFVEASRSDIFREVTLVCTVTSAFIHWLDSQATLHCESYK